MNTDNKDRLKSLFQEMESDSPSFGFENRLMREIHIKASQKAKKRKLNITLALTAGIIGMLAIPATILWKMGWIPQAEMQSIKADFTLPNIVFDPFILSIASVALLLLIGDTLIRRKIWEKKQKD